VSGTYGTSASNPTRIEDAPAIRVRVGEYVPQRLPGGGRHLGGRARRFMVQLRRGAARQKTPSAMQIEPTTWRRTTRTVSRLAQDLSPEVENASSRHIHGVNPDASDRQHLVVVRANRRVFGD
jgi:hypothetical protein